jgi:enoyl-CoA hydratase/carnithine racemase
MEARRISVEERGPGVSVVTLRRPEVLHAISVSMMRDIHSELARLDVDSETKAIVLASEGERAFSAGFDITEMAEFDTGEATAINREREQWLWSIVTLRKPVVAAVRGIAHGAGALLALAADIRVGEHGTAFRVTAGAYGYANLTWRLPMIVGMAVASDLLMTARVVQGHEAYRVGLLNYLVPVDQVTDEAVRVAGLIATNPPGGVADIKRLLREHVGESLEYRYRTEAARQVERLGDLTPGQLFAPFLERS